MSRRRDRRYYESDARQRDDRRSSHDRSNSVYTESSRSQQDGYRFSLVDGQVTNLQEYDDGRWKTERIDANESWAFDGTSLTKTETEHGRIKTSTYLDSDGDGVFTRSGPDVVTGLSADANDLYRSHDGSSKNLEDSYRFSLVDGQVTGLQEYDDGRWKNERIGRNESWTFDGTSLIQQESKRYGVEVSTYTDPDGDGIFSKVSEVFNPVASDPSFGMF